MDSKRSRPDDLSALQDRKAKRHCLGIRKTHSPFDGFCAYIQQHDDDSMNVDDTNTRPVETYTSPDDESLPRFLLAMEGPLITAVGTVYHQKLIVHRLARPMYLSPQYQENPLRLFYALQTAFRNDVRERYLSLPHQVICDHSFSHIRSYDLSAGTMKFDDIKLLLDESKAVYLTDVDDSKVLVKFTSTNNVKALCLFADNDLALKLLCNHGTNKGRHSGTVFMVTEHLECQTLSEYLQSSPSGEHLDAVKTSVINAVNVLHSQNLLFDGDLRMSDILVDNNGVARLIDFDWCGVHGRDQYPFIVHNAEWYLPDLKQRWQ